MERYCPQDFKKFKIISGGGPRAEQFDQFVSRIAQLTDLPRKYTMEWYCQLTDHPQTSFCTFLNPEFSLLCKSKNVVQEQECCTRATMLCKCQKKNVVQEQECYAKTRMLCKVNNIEQGQYNKNILQEQDTDQDNNVVHELDNCARNYRI